MLRNVKELIDDVDARTTVEAGKITQQVSEMYESNSHNYCTNGSFSDSEDKFTGWYRSNNAQVTQNTFRKIMCSDHEHDQHLLSTVVSETVRQKGKSQSKVQSGLCIRQEKTARIRVTIDGTSHYTNAGDLNTSWKTFEFENVATPPYFYTYFYNNVANTTVYITDVEIMGYAAAILSLS